MDTTSQETGEEPRTGERWRKIHAQSLDCVHCGLCLPTCPTYRETGNELSSPRGRIYLMRGVAEGRIPLSEAVRDEAYLCLGCRACETACPSGVRFGSMLEELRAEVEVAKLREGAPKRIEGLALRHLLPYPRRLRLVVGVLAVLQSLRLDRLLKFLLPRRLRGMSWTVSARGVWLTISSPRRGSIATPPQFRPPEVCGNWIEPSSEGGV